MGANCVELAPPWSLICTCKLIFIKRFHCDREAAATGTRTWVARSRRRSLGHNCFTEWGEHAATQHVVVVLVVVLVVVVDVVGLARGLVLILVFHYCEHLLP